MYRARIDRNELLCKFIKNMAVEVSLLNVEIKYTVSRDKRFPCDAIHIYIHISVS